MRTYITAIVLSVALFGAGYIRGQSVSNDDSLMHYLEVAARNNPTVLQRFSEYQAALQVIPQAGSLKDPELNLGVFLTPMELAEGRQVAEIRLMQMFPWFGVLKNARDEMSLMAKARYESLRDAKLQVFYDVQRAWYELYKTGEELRISTKNLEILRTIERLTLVRFKAATPGGGNASPSGGNMSGGNSQTVSPVSSGMTGMTGNPGINTGAMSVRPSAAMQDNSMGASSGGSGLADLYRIQIETGELENNIAFLRDQLSTVTARFNSYLNRPARSIVAIPGNITADTMVVPLPAVSDSMLRNNPMLKMLAYEQQSLEARKKMVTRMGYPMVGLGVSYSVISKNEMSASSMNGKNMIMPMLAVTLPIYRKQYRAMQNEAGLLKTAREQNYLATGNALQTEYYEAMQLLQDAERRRKLYENQSQLAEKSLDILLKSYAASGSSLTDILQIRRQLLNYEFKRIEALTDYNTAFAWLDRLMAFYQ